jgi:hypothetical protein
MSAILFAAAGDDNRETPGEFRRRPEAPLVTAS